MLCLRFYAVGSFLFKVNSNRSTAQSCRASISILFCVSTEACMEPYANNARRMKRQHRESEQRKKSADKKVKENSNNTPIMATANSLTGVYRVEQQQKQKKKRHTSP